MDYTCVRCDETYGREGKLCEHYHCNPACAEFLFLSVVRQAKQEILTDIARGIVPYTLRSFAELHDFVDANEYGGLTEGVYPRSDGDRARDEIGDAETAFANRVQNALDGWIKRGRRMSKEETASGM
jgi:hypothetical protein